MDKPAIIFLSEASNLVTRFSVTKIRCDHVSGKVLFIAPISTCILFEDVLSIKNVIHTSSYHLKFAKLNQSNHNICNRLEQEQT